MQEMWPESNELLHSMESLQIDAVPQDTSNGQVGKSLGHNYSVYLPKIKLYTKQVTSAIRVFKRLNYSAPQKEL